MKKRIIAWVKASNEESMNFVSILSSIIVGISMGILFFISIDTVPATSNDYMPLEQQIVAIQMDHNQIFKKDCDIKVEDNIVTFTFENTECKVSGKFDAEFNLQELKRTDKAIHLWASVLLSVVVCGVISIIFCALLYLIIGVFIWIVKK